MKRLLFAGLLGGDYLSWASGGRAYDYVGVFIR